MYKPLIVLENGDILLEKGWPNSANVGAKLAGFAELIENPSGGFKTYRATPISLWSGRAMGVEVDYMVGFLRRYSRYKAPGKVVEHIKDMASRYGVLTLEQTEDGFCLHSGDDDLIGEIEGRFGDYILGRLESGLIVRDAYRGDLKVELSRFNGGYPVRDLAGYDRGADLVNRMGLVEQGRVFGEDFSLYPYQKDAVMRYCTGGFVDDGSGVLVLPCGSGKTIVVIGIIKRLQKKTLIIVNNVPALCQFALELLDKTTIDPNDIGEYSSRRREIGPITLTTYQILTHKEDGRFKHMKKLFEEDWGLIVYDEVHTLPAPVFRKTAMDLQGRRRLGITATLVREDGKETDIPSLIGQKKADVPWRTLEEQGYIANVSCGEIRVDMGDSTRVAYNGCNKDQRYLIAATNPLKIGPLKEILEYHKGDKVMIIGYYLNHLIGISEKLDIPLVRGVTPTNKRVRLYREFAMGDLDNLIVSTVGNSSLDIPGASVMIQLSGIFGSRQEEAQRVGRILRPKPGDNLAYFYSLVTNGTVDVRFAQNRRGYLQGQGYSYYTAHSFDELRKMMGMPEENVVREIRQRRIVPSLPGDLQAAVDRFSKGSRRRTSRQRVRLPQLSSRVREGSLNSRVRPLYIKARNEGFLEEADIRENTPPQEIESVLEDLAELGILVV